MILLLASLLAAAPATPAAAPAKDPDVQIDELVDTALRAHECAKKKDDVCGLLTAFRKGTRPPELGAQAFTLGKMRSLETAAPDPSSPKANQQLVIGGNPLTSFTVTPENEEEVNDAMGLSTALWQGKPLPATAGVEALIKFIRGALVKPPVELTAQTTGRSMMLRPKNVPGAIAIRALGGKLYVFTFGLKTVNMDLAPSTSIGGMGAPLK